MPKHAPFIAALALQLLILVAIPMKKVIARASGTRIVLKTRPVDPYNIMSGYYVTLSYEVEQPEKPEEQLRKRKHNAPAWVVVEPGQPAWRLVKVMNRKPEELPADQVAIRAKWRGSRLRLQGAGRLYIPEDERKDVERLMRERGREGLVHMAISEDGEAAVIKLDISGRSFGE